MWQLVILSVEYHKNVSMAMYLQPNLERTFFGKYLATDQIVQYICINRN